MSLLRLVRMMASTYGDSELPAFALFLDSCFHHLAAATRLHLEQIYLRRYHYLDERQHYSLPQI